MSADSQITGNIQLRAMKFGITCIALLVSMALSLYGAGLPKDLLEGLAADDFKERESSQQKLLDWAMKKDTSPAPELFRLSQASEDPEIRQRCLVVLKGLSDRDYLTDGRGFLGITMLPEVVKLPGEENPRSAVRISNIVKNGPAERFGLKAGDTIVALNGVQFKGDDAPTEFSAAISDMKPLDKVVLGIKRLEGKIEEVEIILSRHPGENLSVFPQNLHLLDERAREQHFEMWLKELNKKGG